MPVLWTIMDPAHVTRLREEQEFAIAETQERIKKLNKFQDDYDALAKRLETLPHKTTHEVMVPFGKLAFMPGQLIHTNEILVLLGDNWFVERSAKQAVDVVNRRKKIVENQISELEKQKGLLEPRLGFTSELEALATDENVKEIKEEYDAEKEKQWKEQHRKNIKEHRKQMREKASKVAAKCSEKMGEAESNQENVASRTADPEMWARLDELEKLEAKHQELVSSNDEVEDTDKHVQWKDQQQSDDSSELEDESSGSDYDIRGNSNIGSDKAPLRPSTITISHTPPQDTEDPVLEKDDSITSPADIFHKFVTVDQPKSILKQRPSVDQRQDVTSSRDAKLPLDQSPACEDVNPSVKAFTGMVVEKPSSLPEANELAQPTERPVSRFKQRRMQNKS